MLVEGKIMGNKKFNTKLSKKQKVLDIVIVVVIFLALYGYNLWKERELYLFAFTNWHNLMSYLSALTWLSGIFRMMFPQIIAGAVLGIQKGKARRVRDDSSFVLVQDREYYRSKLSGMSPTLMSILIDLDIYGEKDVVATLLQMQNKGMISFQEKGRITILEGSHDKANLSELEMLSIIKEGKLKNRKRLLEWEQNCFADAEEQGFIRKKYFSTFKNNIKTEKAERIMAIAGVLVCINFGGIMRHFVLGSPLLERGQTLVMFGLYLLMAILLFIPSYRVAKRIGYMKRGGIIWERTQLGDEMAEKIAGLAHYINDFTLLSERDKEEVGLWDDYLVYAIILEENEKIVKDISSLYKVDLRAIAKVRC